MNKRQIKKNKQNQIAIYIAKKIGCIERGYLVDLFKSYHTIYKKVKKIIKHSKSINYYEVIVRDYKTNYHHPSYNEQKYKEKLCLIFGGNL